MKHEIDLEKYQFRTDLISEILQQKGSKTGYQQQEQVIEDIKVETVMIDEEGASLLHRKEGLYKTIYFEDVTDEGNFTKLQKVLIKVIQEVLAYENINDQMSCLVVGLGNRDATPDALGPLVSDNLVVTRYLFSLGIDVDPKYRSVATISPGVLGTTGIETKDILLGILEKIQPDFVIVVDALAASHLERVNKTIQITNTGIHPGSGIGNNRAEISKETVSIPVIALGIPTVVDAVTIVSNTINYLFNHLSFEKDHQNNQAMKFVSNHDKDYEHHEEHLSKEEKKNIMGLVGNLQDEEVKSLIAEVLTPLGYNLMVTPKEVDLVISKLSKLVSESLNKGLLRH